MNNEEIDPKIITILDLLKMENLVIPEYQRPYKWTGKNVNQLIDDILINKDKSAYRLGTIVIHNDNGKYKIVDGQQRTITIFLLATAIKELIETNEKIKNDKQKLVKRGEAFSDFEPKSTFSFNNDITQTNIYNNYKAIERRSKDFSTDFIYFFFHKCELVKVVISDISEAFQFFDSQNARGKDLEPQDLLKAYHLRAMNNISSENDKKNVVTKWEAINPNSLKDLFENYLFRIKRWKDNKAGRYFTKNEVFEFKGISPNVDEAFPFTKIYRIANYYTDEFNNSYHKAITQYNFTYPFQIDQVIIDGKRFFEMISYYEELKNAIQVKYKEFEVFKAINSNDYKGRYRTGDRYVYNLFLCGLMYYIDKFGEYEIENAMEKIFIWAYTLRLTYQSVGLKSIDNYARGENNNVNLFIKIKNAITPKVIINMNLPTISNVKSSKTDVIKKLFKDYKYYDGN